MSPLKFDWDPRKAARNVEVHGVSFDEATTCFGDPRSIDRQDEKHSTVELRRQLLGRSDSPRLLLVVFTMRGTTVRIISARMASRRERHRYATA